MNMNRRSFLGLFTASVVAVGLGVAIPAASPGIYSVRFVEAYDVYSRWLFCRIDVARGRELSCPVGASKAIAYHGANRHQIEDIFSKMELGGAKISRAAAWQILQELPEDNGIRGVMWEA